MMGGEESEVMRNWVVSWWSVMMRVIGEVWCRNTLSRHNKTHHGFCCILISIYIIIYHDFILCHGLMICNIILYCTISMT